MMLNEQSRMAPTASRRPRGRPRFEVRTQEPRSTVSTTLPASYHDRLIAFANQRGESVSSLVRQFLILRLK